jgi:hypothetical protein
MGGRILVLLLAAIFVSAPALAVESGESAIALEAGGLMLDGKLGKLFSMDFDYGMNIAWGLTDWLALDIDLLYSEHEQTQKKKYGSLTFTEGQAAVGLRAGYTSRYFIPYASLAPLAMITSYKARYPAGDKTDTDDLKSHGFGGAGSAGLDIFVSDSVTMGFAGKVGVVSADMEFATGADISNRIRAFTFYSALFRMTLIF